MPEPIPRKIRYVLKREASSFSNSRLVEGLHSFLNEFKEAFNECDAERLRLLKQRMLGAISTAPPSEHKQRMREDLERITDEAIERCKFGS